MQTDADTGAGAPTSLTAPSVTSQNPLLTQASPAIPEKQPCLQPSSAATSAVPTSPAARPAAVAPKPDRAYIQNFCQYPPLEDDDNAAEVSCRPAHVSSIVGKVIGTVTISQCAGSLRFQHDMRPEQARQMAAALIAAAEWIEAQP